MIDAPRRRRPRLVASARLQSLRERTIARLRRRLQARAHPRIQLATIVAVSGAAGLLCSYLLLRAGVGNMALRYPAAVAGAYLVFLAMLALWLHFVKRGVDSPDAPDLLARRDDVGAGSARAPADESGWGSDLGSIAGSADEGLPLLIVLVALLGVVVAAVHIVQVAPLLLAELLFDGMLAGALYRRVRAHASIHWLRTLVRRSGWPFLLTGALLAAFGALLQHLALQASSIGPALLQIRTGW